MKYKGAVRFDGIVEVELPDSTPVEFAQESAINMALRRIIATTDNPDAPDEMAIVAGMGMTVSSVWMTWLVSRRWIMGA